MSLPLRPTALAPSIFAAIAFALTLVLVLAGRAPDQMNGYFLLSMNTSHIGQNIVEFTPVSATATTSATATATPSPTASKIQARLSIPSSIASIGSGLSSILGNITSASGNPITSITNALGGIVNGLTTDIDGDLTSLEDNLVQELMQGLGVKDYYNIYIGNVCSGNFTNATDPNTSVTVDGCPSWQSIGAGLSNTSIPSSLQIATVNISVPLLENLGGGTSDVGDTLVAVMTLLFASQVIGLIGNGILALGSLASVILKRSRLITYTVLGSAIIALVSQLIAAVAITIIAGIIGRLINSVGSSISLYATSGKKSIVLAWVSATLVILANIYWLAVWFVEFRTLSLKVRRRLPDQMGNWKGIVDEVFSDLRVGPAVELGLMKQ